MKEYRHYGAVYLQRCKCEIVSFFYLGEKKKNLCQIKNNWQSVFSQWLIINLVTVSVIKMDFNDSQLSIHWSGICDWVFLPATAQVWLNFLFCVPQCHGSSCHSDLFHVLRSVVLLAEVQDGRLCWQGSCTGRSSCQRWAGRYKG